MPTPGNDNEDHQGEPEPRPVLTPEEAQQLMRMAGHELRDPLAATVMGIQLLLRSPELPAASRSLCQAIDRSARGASRRGVALLDVASVYLGQPIVLSLTPTTVGHILARVVDEMERARPSLRIKVTTGAEGRGHWDQERLFTLIELLLSEAATVCEAGSAIAISSQPSPAGVDLRIAPSGETLSLVLPLPPCEGTHGQPGPGTATSGRASLRRWLAHELLQAHGASVSGARAPGSRRSELVVHLPRRMPPR